MDISVIDLVPTVVDPVWIKTVDWLNYLELRRHLLRISPDAFGLHSISGLKNIDLSNLPPRDLPVCNRIEEYGRLKASFLLCHDLQQKSCLFAFLQSLLHFSAQVFPFPLVLLVSHWTPHVPLLSFSEQTLKGRNSFWDKSESTIVLLPRAVS